MVTDTTNAPSRGGRPRRGEAEKKLAQLLDAAAQAFIESGYAGTPIDRIAALAKVGKPTIYARVGGKANLFRMVVEHKLTNLAISDRLGAETPLGRLKEQLAHILSETFRPEFVALFRLYLAEARSFPEIFSVFEHVSEHESKRLLMTCLEADGIGPLRMSSADAAQAMLDMAGSVVMQIAVKADPSAAARDPRLEAARIVDLVLHGALERSKDHDRV